MLDFTSLNDRVLSNMAANSEKVQAYLKDAYDIVMGPLDDNIATTPYEVVYEEDRVKLKLYKSPKADKSKIQTPLLVVYALINRETMLDLQPGRSVVQKFLNDGVDVYMIDWGYPKRKDKYLTIDDHVNGYIDSAVDFVRRASGKPKINLMGICMGGTFCSIYSSFHPEKVKNLVLTVTPSSFDNEDGLLHIWMKDIDVDKVVDAFGNMPGDIMNFGFLLLNPARLMLDKYKGYLSNLNDKVFVENFVRMEKWIFDSPDVPGETFRQFIKDLYQKNLLVQNKLEVGGKLVDLKKITMPVLNIFSRFDHLVPPAASNQITKKLGSKDVRDVCLDTGHIGIYVSSKYQNEFVPMITGWLRERDRDDSVQSGKKSESPRKRQASPEKISEKIVSEKNSPEPPAIRQGYSGQTHIQINTGHEKGFESN